MESLAERYREVRAVTERLAEPLSPEDCQVQSMADASPTKWHLAHTSWFFETFVLARRPVHAPYDDRFGFLFNSYYEALGPRSARHARGLLTRPSLDEVRGYRRHVDDAVLRLLGAGIGPELASVVVLGVNHEQQHQELILTDAKHLLGTSPLSPRYRRGREVAPPRGVEPAPLGWIRYPESVAEIGHPGPGPAGEPFAFDNESPRHRALVGPFRLADRLVTAGEYRAFMADGGYRRPELWLSDGWAAARADGWWAPLYWRELEGGMAVFTLDGVRPIDDTAPVEHVSYYEADAYARWAGARLATEAEWEVAATGAPVDGNLLESGALHPCAAAPVKAEAGRGPAQLFGDVWEWTQSPYVGYPGFRPSVGALGEYNGKFMCNQIVLRGGSCLTPRTHIRASYRNFFPPGARWQMSGFRLANDG